MRYLMIALIMLLPSCDISKTLVGDTKEKAKTEREWKVKTDIMLEYEPCKGQECNTKPVDLKILGESMTVPANSKVKATFGSKRSDTSEEWNEFIGSITSSKKMTSLFVTGSFCIAGGVALMFFGLWNLGIITSAFGASLLACGVAIDKYPWVFFIVLVLVLFAIAYTLYEMVDKAHQKSTLEKVVDKIDNLKTSVPEAAKRYVTDPLAKDKDAKMIKKHVRKARD